MHFDVSAKQKCRIKMSASRVKGQWKIIPLPFKKPLYSKEIGLYVTDAFVYAVELPILKNGMHQVRSR